MAGPPSPRTSRSPRNSSTPSVSRRTAAKSSPSRPRTGTTRPIPAESPEPLPARSGRAALGASSKIRSSFPSPLGQRKRAGVRRDRGKKGGDAGRAQRYPALAGLPAQALDHQRRLVADAIDREHREVGAADQPGQ